MLYHFHELRRDPSVGARVNPQLGTAVRDRAVDYDYFNHRSETTPLEEWRWRGTLHFGQVVNRPVGAEPLLKLYECGRSRDGDTIAIERWCCPTQGGHQPYRVRYRTELGSRSFALPRGIGLLASGGDLGRAATGGGMLMDANSAVLAVLERSAGEYLSETVREIHDELTGVTTSSDLFVPDCYTLGTLVHRQIPLLREFAMSGYDRQWKSGVMDFIQEYLTAQLPINNRFWLRHCDTPVAPSSLAAHMTRPAPIDTRPAFALHSALPPVSLHHLDEVVEWLSTLAATDVDLWWRLDGAPQQWQAFDGMIHNRYRHLWPHCPDERTAELITLSSIAQALHGEWLQHAAQSQRRPEPVCLHLQFTPNDELLTEIWSLDRTRLLYVGYLDLALCYLTPLSVTGTAGFCY